MEGQFIPTVIFMKGIGRMAKRMVSGNISITVTMNLKLLNLQVNLVWEKEMEKENLFGQMEVLTKGNLKTM